LVTRVLGGDLELWRRGHAMLVGGVQFQSRLKWTKADLTFIRGRHYVIVPNVTIPNVTIPNRRNNPEA
jgi:hypothetical protein